jgi:hypothetical protein
MSEQFEKDLERLEKNKAILESEGYFELRVIEGCGICGLMKFLFTTGLCEGIATNGFDSFEGRWCYPHEYLLDSIMALKVWDGKKDPKGRWIKYKGRKAEYGNPKSIKNEIEEN